VPAAATAAACVGGVARMPAAAAAVTAAAAACTAKERSRLSQAPTPAAPTVVEGRARGDIRGLS
jgi:hypothetical protein